MTKKFDIRRDLFEWAQALVAAMIIFGLLFTFGARVIGVQGTSMDDTLHTGDKLLISNVGYTPQRGDVIMFTKRGVEIPGHGKGNPLVKRVMAVAGDTIDVNADTHEVIVNGVVLEESKYIHDPVSVAFSTYLPLTVPEGYIFAMGDNRNVSMDSRDSRVGLIDTREVLGHVLTRVLPFGAFGPIYEPEF
ncbi:signal peptidase I [Clostridia bacterium]|nr:signal peptidase I [Clostridia bacterium]